MSPVWVHIYTYINLYHVQKKLTPRRMRCIKCEYSHQKYGPITILWFIVAGYFRVPNPWYKRRMNFPMVNLHELVSGCRTVSVSQIVSFLYLANSALFSTLGTMS